jgi:hypothetical protein
MICQCLHHEEYERSQLMQVDETSPTPQDDSDNNSGRRSQRKTMNQGPGSDMIYSDDPVERRRARNNEAARRCRDRKRLEDEDQERRLSMLECGMLIWY